MAGSFRKSQLKMPLTDRCVWSRLTGVFLLVSLSLANAQSGGVYSITRSTVDGGGGTVQGGPYVLTGTTGQPEPGPAHAGGVYAVTGGFWPADADANVVAGDGLFADGFEN